MIVSTFPLSFVVITFRKLKKYHLSGKYFCHLHIQKIDESREQASAARNKITTIMKLKVVKSMKKKN